MNPKFKPALSAGVIALASVVILALYVGDSWLDPKLPAVIGAALILPISVLAGLLIFPEGHKGKGRIAVRLSTVLFATIFGLGIPIVWSQPQVRSYAVNHAPDALINLWAALGDPAPDVGRQACHRILLESAQIERLVDSLQTQYPLANACLNSASQSPNRNAVATKLRTRWHRGLVTAPSNADTNSCESADSLAKLPVANGQKAADLLDCSLRAPDDETRQCCATALNSLHDTCEDLAAQIDTRKLVDNHTVAALGALSFAEKTAELEFPELAGSVDLRCPAMKAFALKLACLSQSEFSSRPDTKRFLQWLFDKHTSCLGAEAKAEQTEVHLICDALMEAGADQVTIPSEMICASHLAAVEVSRQARQNVGGLSSREGSALASQIISGSNLSKQKRAKMMHWLNSVQDKPGAANIDEFSAKDKRAILKEMMQNQRTPEDLINTPVDQMKEIQRDLNEKLAKNPGLMRGLKERAKGTKDAPDLDGLAEAMDSQMESITNAQKRAQDALKSNSQ